MTLENLHRTLNQRKRPEDVAEMIEVILNEDLNRSEMKTLRKASGKSLVKSFWKYTSMLESFSEPIGAEKQIRKAVEVFKASYDFDNFDFVDPKEIEIFIKQMSKLIGKEFGQNNLMSDRLNRKERLELGFDISKRRYNKLFRHLKRLEKKLNKIIQEIKKTEFQKIAKHGLVHHIELEDFVKDKFSACFIAYYTSRCNLRSEFTITGQQKPYDEIADMLFKKATVSGFLKNNQTANFYTISYVYPVKRVLDKLTDNEKGMLLGKWTTTIEEISTLLKKLWNENDINRETMVVKRGNDSSTWNNTAGAWNKARDVWMNIVYSLGLESILDTICFGKVLRLMAGDVVAWHISSGGALDSNTQVWNKLPLPWEVFNGEKYCNKKMVIEICEKANLDPEKSGWIAPKTHSVSEFIPTPELVHGVTIFNPYLATILKKEKFFSGK
ncbi:hypothetical protein ATE84_0078 [Aquimarina sp. MAR_2010_214]|uniref:hypothetical protein n=1 Tax=Aquimarina sp. MAR_2010_214 TaxID=1250026 RepID=UPI000CB94497|nr:hypothetical protein [Aquimarina sp. MAR_2010_214]PKV48090.1 hypothetical protein ATE84_0078 [Aquimarina sp. MAR_2010_214]